MMVGKLLGPRTQIWRDALLEVPFQQIVLIGGRTLLQLDLCSGNRDTSYRSSPYWHMKSTNY
jgi:hypothetical protein